MKLSIFLIAFLFAPLTVEAQYQIINPTVNQEEDDYKKRQRLQAERIRMEQQQQMQFMYHQR